MKVSLKCFIMYQWILNFKRTEIVLSTINIPVVQAWRNRQFLSFVRTDSICFLASWQSYIWRCSNWMILVLRPALSLPKKQVNSKKTGVKYFFLDQAIRSTVYLKQNRNLWPKLFEHEYNSRNIRTKTFQMF